MMLHKISRSYGGAPSLWPGQMAIAVMGVVVAAFFFHTIRSASEGEDSLATWPEFGEIGNRIWEFLSFLLVSAPLALPCYLLFLALSKNRLQPETVLALLVLVAVLLVLLTNLWLVAAGAEGAYGAGIRFVCHVKFIWRHLGATTGLWAWCSLLILSSVGGLLLPGALLFYALYEAYPHDWIAAYSTLFYFIGLVIVHILMMTAFTLGAFFRQRSHELYPIYGEVALILPDPAPVADEIESPTEEEAELGDLPLRR